MATPNPSSFCLTAGSASTATASAFILLTTAGGVLAGTNSEYQAETLNPGRPDSATVGYSAAVVNRCAEVTARPRTWPARACCNVPPMVLNITSIRPG